MFRVRLPGLRAMELGESKKRFSYTLMQVLYIYIVTHSLPGLVLGLFQLGLLAISQADDREHIKEGWLWLMMVVNVPVVMVHMLGQQHDEEGGGEVGTWPVILLFLADDSQRSAGRILTLLLDLSFVVYQVVALLGPFKY